MRYEPVKIMTLFQRIFTRDNEFIRQTPYYYQVRSKLLGDCGHKHRTKIAAEPCLRRMKKEWSARRAIQGKKAQAVQAAKRSFAEICASVAVDAIQNS